MRPPRLTLELVVSAAVAATVFSFALGSTRVIPLLELGRPLRWAMLVALAGLAALVVWRTPRVRPAGLYAAASLAALALVSSAWSVRPGLTLGRALTLAVLLAAAAGLAAGARGRDGLAGAVVDGVLAGAAAVALAGLLVLAVDSDLAIEPATEQYPARYNGLGENPNTASLLLALATPIALARALNAPRRLLTWALVALFAASIAASASRGALLAAWAGCCIVAVLAGGTARRRALVAASATVALVCLALVTQIPQPKAPMSGAGVGPPPPTRNAESAVPLEEEIGRPRDGGEAFRRSLLGSGGRVGAWKGGLEQGLDRPALGYGFGTEDRVFADRYYVFFGTRVENAYISAFLQLGLLGLAAFVALLTALVRPAAHRWRRLPWTATAAAGALAAGLAAGVTQSYLWSVGNIATTSFWLCAFALAAAATARSSDG